MIASTTIKVCAWHEPRQQVLAGFSATHSLCPICRHVGNFDGLVSLIGGKILTGGWRTCPGHGFMPVLYRWRHNRLQTVNFDSASLLATLRQDGDMITQGSLDDCLTASRAIA